MAEEKVEIPNFSIETIDQAITDWFSKTVDAHVECPGFDRKKVPVIFAAGERWTSRSIKSGFRDTNGVLILPIISIHRNGIEQDTSMSALGVETPNMQISKLISPKTNLLMNSISSRNQQLQKMHSSAVYEVTTLPFPDISILVYEIVIQTQYIVQMNNIIEKIAFELDMQKSFVMPIDNDGRHAPTGEQFEDRKKIVGGYFVGLIESANHESNFQEFTDQERIVRYTMSVRVPAYTHTQPEGEKTVAKVERTSFSLNFKSEESHFVDDFMELELIFSSKK
jgi:hypothetical protein